jgi:3-oxoacyl-[acyl-carrier-protein] synthase II
MGMGNGVVKRRVVITGYGMITPLGKNAVDTFHACSRGKSGVGEITAFDATGLPCGIAGQVDEEWCQKDGFGGHRRLLKFASRGLRLMSVAGREAAARAALHHISRRERIGVSLGSYGEDPSLDEIVWLHRFYDGDGHWDFEGLMQSGGYNFLRFYRRKPDMASAVMARLLNCRGPVISSTSACAAGSQAVGEAFRMIQDGQCRVMLTGGCESTLNLAGFLGFVLLGALATRYDTPETASRPFDRKRNGFVLSEGAAALVLEDFEHARRRGASIKGEILGYGSSLDAYRITDSDPRGQGAALAMRSALSDAGLEPEQIQYINAHGTSTLKNDISETRAIKTVFGEYGKRIPVSSNKSMLGHCIAAAGPIELVLTLMGMRRSLILPTINQTHPDPKCDLWYVPNKAVCKAHTTAMCNSFGFGGQNGSVCMGVNQPREHHYG